MRRLPPYTLGAAVAVHAERKAPPPPKADLFSKDRQANIHRTTPQPFIDVLLDFAGPAGIGLDPCSNTRSMVPARTRWFGPYPQAPVSDQLVVPGCGAGGFTDETDPTGNYRSMLSAHPAPEDPIWKDGLQQGWGGHGLVYVNYPYLTADHRRWVAKMNFEATEPEHFGIVCLTKAAPGSEWFQVAKADRVCFWKGRLAFDGLDAGAKFDSAVLYWGPNTHAFESCFSKKGKVVPWG